MVNRDFVAYTGDKFTIEWYFDEKGNSQSLEYFLKLNIDMQIKVFYLFKRMADSGKINDITKYRNEGDKIYAFKPQPYRFLSFFVEGKKIIITNAFIKRTDKIPANEKELAIRLRLDYLKRISEGKYYEQ